MEKIDIVFSIREDRPAQNRTIFASAFSSSGQEIPLLFRQLPHGMRKFQVLKNIFPTSLFYPWNFVIMRLLHFFPQAGQNNECLW
jgi:hypothetical protein